MTVDETPPPASAVSESGGGQADQGGIANTGIIHGNVTSEFHYHYPPTERHPRPQRRLSRRMLVRAAAGVGLGAAVSAVAWGYAPGLLRGSGPKPTMALRIHPGPAVTFGTDEPYESAGRQFAAAGQTVWSVALGMLRGEPLAVAGHEDGTIQLWDPVAGRARGEALPGHQTKVFSLAVHGTTAVSACVNGTLLVWDLTSDPPRCTPATDTVARGINGVAFGTVDGRTVVVSACEDGTVRVWDPANPRRNGRILGAALDAAVNSIAVGVVDGRTIAVTGSTDGAIRLWDVTGERMLRKIGSHEKTVWALAVGSVDGKPIAVSGSEDGVLRRWDLRSAPSPGEKLLKITRAVKTVAIGAVAGRTVAVFGCDDSSVRMIDLGTGDAYGRGLTGPESAPQSLAISDFGGRPTVVSGHWDGTLWAWRL